MARATLAVLSEFCLEAAKPSLDRRIDLPVANLEHCASDEIGIDDVLSEHRGATQEVTLMLALCG